jgi:hypothetical protein
MKTKLKIPKGWRRVTKGRIRDGDRWKFNAERKWIEAICTVGESVRLYRAVIRRITRKGGRK